MDKKILSKLGSLLVLFPGLENINSAIAQEKPNIVVVLIDDLGYGELPAYGNTFNETPYIDQLAEQGILFTNAYAPAPVSSPTRASYHTGQYTPRHGITDFIPRNSPLYLDPDEHVTINEVLQNEGYFTGVIGKWHLDTDFENNFGGPEAHGFDWTFGIETEYIAGGDYFYPYSKISTITEGEENEFLPDRLFAEANQFIHERSDETFFLSVQLFSVHMTLDAPEHLVEKYKDKYEEKYGEGTADYFDQSTPKHAGAPDNPYMAAMIERIDYGIGSIMNTLEELDLADNTLLIVTSDNGGDEWVANNGGLRAAKTWLYEGGIRVPMIARYPEYGQSGIINDTPVNFIDFYPTFMDLAGGTTTQLLDGVSIAPLFRNETIERDALFWYYPAGIAAWNARKACVIRKGDYKLIYRYGLAPDFYELYNLSEDPGEQNNLYDSEHETAAILKNRLDEWMEEMGLGKWAEGEIEVFDFESDFPGEYGTNGNIYGPGNPPNDAEDVNNEYFTRVPNPYPDDLNSSDTVGKFHRLKNGYWWAYAWFNFEPIYVGATEATPKYLHIKVNKPISSRFCIQIVGPNNASTPEIIRVNNKVGEWEDLVFEIVNPGLYSQIQIKPDFENSANPPYPDRLDEDIYIYFDDIIINDDPKPRGGELFEFEERTIMDFEDGFFGRKGTNGNGDGFGEDHYTFQIVSNPFSYGSEGTEMVGRFKRRKTGHWWAYAWFEFQPIEVTHVPVYVHVMVNKPVFSPVTVQIKDQHAAPGSNTGEMINENQSSVNEWQDFVFKINNPGIYSYFEFKPDFVNQNPLRRLDEDIYVYFDDIIINSDPTPRQPVIASTDDKLVHSGMHVFPTITNGMVNIELNNNKTMDIKLFDIRGNLIQGKTIFGGYGSLDLSAEKPGLYIIQATSENEAITAKIIKQ